MRLLVGLFVVIYAASLAGSVRHFSVAGGTVGPAVFYGVAVLAFCFLGATLIVLGRPWRLETFKRQIFALLMCFYVGFFTGAWAQKVAGVPAVSMEQILIGSVGFQVAGLLLIWRYVREHHTTWSEGFGFAHQRRRALMLGFALALVFLPIGWGLQQVSALTIKKASKSMVEPKEQATVEAFRKTPSWIPRMALGLMAIFLAPVVEETLFRGILYPLVKQAGYPRLAFWGVSFVFAAIHVNLVTLVPLMALALLLTVLYERTDNLLAPITAHAIFNALNFATLCLEK